MSRISVKGTAKVETVYETIQLLKLLGLDEEDIREEVKRRVDEIVSGLGGRRERWGWRVKRERILGIVPLEEAEESE